MAYDYNVLYAEDDSKTQSIFKGVLETLFTHVQAANDGKEAIEYFQNKHFDIVITDINMPKTNGFELAEFIKSISPATPILIISALGDYSQLSRAIELGVDGYILKPIDTEKFMNKIRKIVEKLDSTTKHRHHETLLREYKEAIDRSSIVSKTDVNGLITYANEAFTKISQYSTSELLGKPHNIIRHPDMPASVYEDLWRTIKAKKPWRGIVKNRKKDGSAYYVQTLVNPILNEKGEIEEFIAIRHDITELESYRENLEERLRESMDEIIQTQKEIVYTMGAIGEKRSKETGLHVKRVAHYSYTLARLYGLDEKEAQLLKEASPMHDIGKVGVPDSVLQKPGPLNDEEWEIIKQHSTIGYDMLKHSNREILKAAALIAHEHHEFWNGKGYPRGLKGEDIHIFGRIIAIVDVYDALGHDRVYKKAWPLEQIIELFQKEKGEQFDPILSEIFLKNIEHFETIRKNLGDDETMI
jgi:PAS domain S-box-containing protein